MSFKRDKRGFTLVELLVVMAIFLTVIFITTSAFETIVHRVSQQSKSAETQIQGIVGLELLRADLERAGFGLPWSFNITTPGVAYGEAVSPLNVPTNPSTLFNDAPPSAPRAILSGNSTFNTYEGVSSKYLVIKSTLADANPAAAKWTTVSYDAGGRTTKEWGDVDRDFVDDDRVIVVKNSLIATPPTRELMASASTVFSSRFATYTTLTNPRQNGDTFEIYGVNPSTNLWMPFNRADYYIKRESGIPKSCAPNTGILYRSTISQVDGRPSAGVPLLDCVADLQVVYGLDTDATGIVNTHTVDPPASAALIREQLREIRIYVLAHEGKKDRIYSHPSTTIDVGESFDGSTVTGRRFKLNEIIGADYNRYRWKVYTIVVRPKNLIQ